MSLGYSDPENALKELDSFSWAVRNVLTPFVGNGPMPGKNYNAYINSMQFRGNKEVRIPKPEGVYRIFLTGGSTAYSAGAPSDDRTIGGFLNQMLNSRLFRSTSLNYEVFTVANPAWASTHERIIIENRLSELEPDLVISFSGTNDVHWGMFGRNILWYRSYADQLFWELLNTAYGKGGYDLMPEVVEIYSSAVDPGVVAKRLEKNIRVCSFILALERSKYVFILQPTLPVSRKGLTAREHKIYVEKWAGTERDFYFMQAYNHIRKRMMGLDLGNFYFIDQAGIFDTLTEQDDIFLDSHHFGDRGNKIIAENILREALPIIDAKKD